jgi:hypothetical protein
LLVTDGSLDMTQQLQALPAEILDRLVRIHAALSPEALTGDGEIPEPVWRERKAELDGQLIGLQMAHGLSQDGIGEDVVFAEFDRRQDLARRGQLRRARP